MDRRNSRDDSTPRPTANPNVFDDEYALGSDEEDFMPSVSDGFRPAGVNAGDQPWHGDRQDHDRSISPRPPFTNAASAEPDLRRMASRNSTMKPPCSRESISHDPRSSGAHHTRGPSSQATAGLQHRASISSNGSFATMAHSDSPFAVGPSHPYGMYPQNPMARSPSVTTSSTQRQPQRSISLQRPAHPYGMYTQNVVEDDEPAMPPVQSSIPVGFPGLNTGYHRQIGPDGEEQDIIGPDGHTEQLPPYSRYPEEGPTKAALAAGAASTRVEVVPSPPTASEDTLVSPLSPTSPIHHQPARAQPQETENRGMPAVAPVPTTSTQEDSGISEKQEGTKAEKSWRSKKIMGRVPVGVALILLVLIAIFAIVLGAAIGTFVAKNKDKDRGGRNKGNKDHDEASPQFSGPSGSLFDATPIPTPSSLPPLPTGAYALPLGIAQESSPGCLTKANQLSAWSCKMTFAPLVLTINNTLSGEDNRPMASLEAFAKPDGGVQYGVQPPALDMQTMQLVMDLDYKAFGEAFHFQAMYDKIVVLNQDGFAAGATFRKRDDKPPFRHRFQVMPGDTPWYCIWNSTYIEGYIYARDNSTAATFSTFPTTGPNPYGSSIPVDTSIPTTVTGGAFLSNAEVTPTPTPAIPVRKRGDGDYPRLPPYPRIVKIEERRLPGSPQPYCQKMRLLDNGQMIEAADNSGAPIKLYLQEEDPSLEEFYIAAGSPPPPPFSSSPASNGNDMQRNPRMLEKRRDPAGACHCQWMFQ